MCFTALRPVDFSIETVIVTGKRYTHFKNVRIFFSLSLNCRNIKCTTLSKWHKIYVSANSNTRGLTIQIGTGESSFQKMGRRKFDWGFCFFLNLKCITTHSESLRSWWKKKFMLGGIKFYFKLFCSVSLWSGLAWTQLLSGQCPDTSKTILTCLMADAWVCSELTFPTIIRSSCAWSMLICFSHIQLFVTHGL